MPPLGLIEQPLVVFPRLGAGLDGERHLAWSSTMARDCPPAGRCWVRSSLLR